MQCERLATHGLDQLAGVGLGPRGRRSSSRVSVGDGPTFSRLFRRKDRNSNYRWDSDWARGVKTICRPALTSNSSPKKSRRRPSALLIAGWLRFSLAATRLMLRETFADMFGPLPAKAVAAGDTWPREYVEPIPHFGALRSSVKYLYAGKKDALERITYTIQTRYELPKDDMSVLFRIVKGSVDTEKAAGTMSFDAAAGYLVEHDRTMLLRGALTIEAMERPQATAFTSENAVKIRIKSIRK